MFELAPAIPSRSDLDWCWYLRRQGRIGEALERALHDIGVMHPSGWADWQSSLMTDTGAPVEMQFTANQPGLSLRTEVDDPGKDPSGRVAKACAVITELGGNPPPAAIRDVISAAQGAADLRFGAWLGLHQYADRLGMTLYAEIPPAASDLTSLLSNAAIKPTLQALGDAVSLTIIGYHTDTGEITLFFETEHAPEDVIPQLVGPAKVSAEPLLRNINEMLDAGVEGARPLKKLGFSYTIHKDDSAPTLALQVSSKALFGLDDVIEQRVRNYPGDHVKAYAGLADQLAPAPSGLTNHGMVGLHPRGDRYPLLSIGVAAPWFCPFDTM